VKIAQTALAGDLVRKPAFTFRDHARASAALAEVTLMPRRCLPALLVLAAILPAGRAAAQQSGYPAVPLLSTDVTTIGETLRYATSGPARVTASIVTIAPGSRTIVHKHGVPMFAYILGGELTVDYGDRGKHTYRQGQALMEAMDVAHYGVNTGAEPVRILVVYMGADGAENVIPTP
jgi:quercetin dioxygenase-like cupin family protein